MIPLPLSFPSSIDAGMNPDTAPLHVRLARLAERVRAEELWGADVRRLSDLCVELDAKFGYELAMLVQHGVATPHTACGYVLCSVRRDGKFNKWAKVAGGRSPGGPFGNYLVYENRSDADEALAAMHAAVRECFRVFPVVLIAGDEAERSTCA